MTLVFIHGAGASGLAWHLQLSYFKDALAINLPGHPNGSGFSTIPEYTDFVEDYLRRNNVEDPVLVGHSMGGAISMELSLRKPNLAGLILVGTGARLRVRPDILSMILANYEEGCKLVASCAVAPGCDPVIIDRLAEEMLKIPATVSYGDFSACDKFDRMNDIENISYPTLIVCGAEDRLTPVKYSQYLQEKIRNSKLVIIPGAGHSVMLEKHREFNGAIEAFLSGLKASQAGA